MQQPTKAISLSYVTRLTTNTSLRCDELVVATLMIPLGVIVGEELVDRMIQGTFTRHHHPFRGFFLDGAHEPFTARVQIWIPRGLEDWFHPGGLEPRIERLGE